LVARLGALISLDNLDHINSGFRRFLGVARGTEIQPQGCTKRAVLAQAGNLDTLQWVAGSIL
jgi:hypothetical protein